MEKPGWAVVDTSVTDQELCEAMKHKDGKPGGTARKMNKEKKRLWTFVLFILSTAVLVAFDQWTKSLAVEHLKGQEDISLIPVSCVSIIWKTEGQLLASSRTRELFC